MTPEKIEHLRRGAREAYRRDLLDPRSNMVMAERRRAQMLALADAEERALAAYSEVSDRWTNGVRA